MINLLVLDEGERIKAIENLSDVFYIIDANNNYRYISIVEGKDEADIHKTCLGGLNVTKSIKTLSEKVDISSDLM